MLEWMFWRYETIILFGVMGFAFLTLAILDLYRRSVLRKGFLPMPTTRGDRFFLGIMSIVTVGLLWLGFVPFSVEWCLIPALAVFSIILIWG